VPTTRKDYELLLDKIAEAETIGEARLLIDKFREAHRPGQRPKPVLAYRCLARKWSKLQVGKPSQSAKAMRNSLPPAFWQEIQRLGLKLKSAGSVRNAVAKGEKARDAAREKRRGWMLVPVRLTEYAAGRRKRLVIDSDRAWDETLATLNDLLQSEPLDDRLFEALMRQVNRGSKG
jgi:hypothetical protein